MLDLIFDWLDPRTRRRTPTRPLPRSFVFPRPRSSLGPRWRADFGFAWVVENSTRYYGLIADPANDDHAVSVQVKTSHNHVGWDAATLQVRHPIEPTGATRPVERPPLSLEGEATIDDVTAGAPFNRKLASFALDEALACDVRFTTWIQWGDGEISMGRLLRDATRWWICGAHCYTFPGRYQARVTLSDGETQAVSRNIWIQVDAAVEPVTPICFLNVPKDSLRAPWDSNVGKREFLKTLS